MAILVAFLTAIFYLPLDLLLTIITLITSRKLQGIISYIPFLLSYLFGLSYIYLNLYYVVYIIPFYSIVAIALQSFNPNEVPLNYVEYMYSYYHGTSVSAVPFSVGLGIISVLVWTIVLTLVALPLFRRLYYKPSEEGRII